MNLYGLFKDVILLKTWEHLALTFYSMFLATLITIPIGVFLDFGVATLGKWIFPVSMKMNKI